MKPQYNSSAVTCMRSVFFFILLLAYSQAFATIRYVKEDGTGDGSSWANASGDLQAMITNSISAGDEVWVAAGTYKPTTDTNRSVAFTMKNGVAILGGFPSTGDPSMLDRDWTVHLTILSGDIGTVGSYSDNCYHVIFNSFTQSSPLTNSAVLDGFKIVGGNANGVGINSAGAGMCNINASPFIANTVFSQNSASNGGGMCNETNSSPIIFNTIFSGNSATNRGGGMANFTTSSVPTISSTVFSGNIATNGGGGVFNENSSPSLTNCTLSGNSAPTGGGMYNLFFAVPTVKNCILWGNSNEISQSLASSLNFTFCIIQGGYVGTGNLNVDPLFIQQPPIGIGIGGNLRLQVCSPAIDAGNDASNTAATDLDGNPRKIEAITGGQMIDRGAYEYQTTNTLSDGTHWNVNAAVAVGGNGTSWTCAFRDLQLAIAAADSGDEVWVAAGTYKPTAGTNRSISFSMKNGVTILGGFPSIGNPNLADRNWETNITTLSGDIGTIGSIVDNSYHVIYNNFTQANPLTNSAVLDGFTITGGNTLGLSFSEAFGGGMYNLWASPTLTNTIFSQNLATTAGGGGLYNNFSSPIITNGAFVGNSAGTGGGMHNSTSFPMINNTKFSNNVAVYGGGIYNLWSSHTIINTTLSANSAFEGGGVYNTVSSPILTNNTFIGNIASKAIAPGAPTNAKGGAIYNSSSSPSITNTTFSGNDAGNNGGGIHNITSSPIVINCIFWGNSSQITNENTQSNPTVSYSIVQGGFIGTGNLNVDPSFNQQPPIGLGVAGDLRLEPCSPAIDAGFDGANIATTDLDGNTRKVEVITGGQMIDMGAYEYQTNSPISDGTRWHVNAAVLSAGNGTSWDCAYKDLQHALASADNGDEIWVAAGTYKPTNDNGRSISFSMKNDVAILGGFPNTGDPDLLDRDWATHLTVLSGDIGTVGNNIDNSYHIIYNNFTQTNPLTNTAVLDGFTITGANSNSNQNFPADYGGGMFNRFASPTITNTVFTNNSAIGGGGMYNEKSNPILSNAIFSSNSAIHGGGMYNNNANPVIATTRFSGNSAVINGGGIHNENFCVNIITNSLFSGNSAAFGGGMFNRWSSPPVATITTITNTTFSGNVASNSGGGMYNISSSLNMKNCIFWGNSTEIENTGSNNNPNISYSIVQGGYIGIGNLNLDPLFIQQPPIVLGIIGDLHLQACSPARDAGSAIGAPSTDYDGDTRPNGSGIDMGFDEITSLPNFVLPANGSTTVTCPADAEIIPNAPVINTACSQFITITGPTVSPILACEGTKTYTWIYTYGNFSQTWEFIYTIERNDFTIPTDGAATVTCPSAITAPTPPTVTSNCGESLTPSAPVITSIPNSSTCETARTYTYTYSDCEGNTANWNFVYTIERNSFGIPANGAAHVQCVADAVMPSPPVVFDNCGEPIIPVTLTPVDIPSLIICTGTRTYSFVYTDCVGNTAIWSYIYHISDTTPPLITSAATTCEPVNFILTPTGTATLKSENIPFSAIDNCGGTVSFVPDSITYNASQVGIPQTFEFTVIDWCNNNASCVKTVNIIVPRISISEALVDIEPASASDPVGHLYATFLIKVKNTGNATLNNLTLMNDLASLGCTYQGFAPGGTPTIVASTAISNPLLNSGYNGVSNTSIFNGSSGILAIGQEIIVQFRLLMDPNCIGAPTLSQMLNQSLGSGMYSLPGAIPNTITVTDLSDDGLNPFNATGASNGGTDMPTIVYLPNIHASMRVVGMSAPFDGSCVAGNLIANVEIRVKNTGNTVLNGTQVSSNIAAQLGTAFIKIIPGSLFYMSHLSNPTLEPSINHSFNGSTIRNLFATPAILSSNEEIVIGFIVEINPSVPGAPITPRFNATVDAISTIAAGAFYVVSDLTDAGSLPESFNESAPGHTALSHNDPTQFGAPSIVAAPQNLMVNVCDTWQVEIQSWLNNAAGIILNSGVNSITCIVNDYFDNTVQPGWVNTGCGANQYRDVRFTIKFVDVWGEMSEMHFCARITLVDDLPPSFDMQPMHKTIDCGTNDIGAMIEAWLADGGGAWAHACSGDIMWSNNYNDSLVTCNTPVTVFFTATDECGRTATTSATLTVTDTTAPLFTSVPANTTINCPETPVFGAPTANDACSSINITYSDSLTGGQCPTGYSVTRTWLATDSCGNSQTASATITVLPQTAVSTLSISCSPGISVIAPVGATGAVVTFSLPSATTTCNGSASVIQTTGASSGQIFAVGVNQVCFSATDACGNQQSCCFYINVIEGIAAPFVLTATAPPSQTVTCGEPIVWTTPISSTSCPGGLVALSISDSETGTTCSGILYTRIWTATDACGNEKTISSTIFQLPDTEPPTFTSLPQMDQMILCDTPIPIGTATASDVCGFVTVMHIETNSGASACTTVNGINYGFDTYVHWTATDGCGNQTSATTNIWVLPVTNIGFLNKPLDKHISCNEALVFEQPVAKSFLADIVDITFVDITNLDSCGLSTVTRRWTALDALGNTCQAEQTISSMPDHELPTITLPFSITSVDCQGSLPSVTPIVSDNCTHETNLAVSHTDIQMGTTVLRTYQVVDACGNVNTASLSIALVDNVPPLITDYDSLKLLDCKTPVVFDQPSVYDACQDLTLSYVDSVFVSLCEETHTRTWTATDQIGNVGTAMQTILVTDKEAPVFTGFLEPIAYACNTDILFDTPIASDMCHGVSLDYVDISTLPICGNLGYTITRTWTANDGCNNSAQISQIITVEEDTQEPVVLQAPQAHVEMTFADFAQWNPDPIATLDNCSSLPIITPLVTQIDLCNYNVVYVITDECSNTTSVQQNISIIDGPCLALGNDTPLFEGIKLYPNPTLHYLVLELPNSVDVSGLVYSVFDVFGRVSIEGFVSGNITTINIQTLQQGSYFFKVSNDQGTNVTSFVKISD